MENLICLTVVGLLVAQSLWLIVAASRAVSREVAAAAGGG